MHTQNLCHRHRQNTHIHIHTQIDDIKDRLVSGSEGSRAMREIRTRDMHFDMNTFVRSVKVCGRAQPLLVL